MEENYSITQNFIEQAIAYFEAAGWRLSRGQLYGALELLEIYAKAVAEGEASFTA